ncbi:MAG: 3-methyl-2-oxobutanoate hydroxymethyltransferase [Flavobacteriaceae bacterium]|nr:3-methyl-2-oxobutanoate hydroxymethyltransferase [Flavobacteriaceae bacterium]
MKNFLLTTCLVIATTFTSLAQFTEVEARGIIDTLFEGFHSGDTLLMKSVLAPSAVMQTVQNDKNGTPIISEGPAQNLVDAVQKRPADQQWEEKLLGYTVQLDDNLAHVWTPYEFWVNGFFSHCGANSFTLAKFKDGWKIVHIIDSRRQGDCTN